jgi:hypothetical protein
MDVSAPRRRFQFRLRILMVGVTLFMVALGWWYFQEVSMAHERKAALATI